jgi:hypothetical protein
MGSTMSKRGIKITSIKRNLAPEDMSLVPGSKSKMPNPPIVRKASPAVLWVGSPQ